MLKKIGSYDAKTKLPEILRRVETGEAFTITNRGKPIADLIPCRVSSHLKTKTAINTILNAKKHKITDGTFAKLKNDGRK